MLNTIAKKIFGSANERVIKSMRPIVAKINELEPSMQKLSDEELQGKTTYFREQLKKGKTLDDLLPEAFATVREAAVRTLGMRHYDVQMIGGIAMHNGCIAEMRTGEGKTLVATLAAYLNALSGDGVHLITVNDYLASRDAEWMGQIYRFLGLTVGVIIHGLSDRERQESYSADITYGTNNEFGFDYLRDNMKFRLEDYVQKKMNFCIVDEVDSILIDESRTPLIISGPTEDSTDKYYRINKIIPSLKHETHFNIDEKAKSATLTDDGIAKVEGLLNIKNLYDPHNIDTLHHVQAALKAHVIFKKDIDYVVQDNKVVIVDEFTGRIMPGRRWSDGLHQAVEAKENVEVENENQTLASITFQNYFRMYNKLAGMTGTADTEATEFKNIYKLDVVVIPTNRPPQRIDNNDLIYKNTAAKFKAIVEEIKLINEKQQPVLVGTISIENSELLSRELRRNGIKHNVLNAKHHDQEAEIIAQAGRSNSVTIATNMAGRGTDIVLGGNPEMLAKAKSDPETEEYKNWLKKFETECKEDKELVLNAGGLYILGTERHDSRRIDNQLRGRSGRQGDPGESRFYLSLEDDLFRIFGGDKLKGFMSNSLEDDEPIEHKWLSRAIENAQMKVEGHNFDIRKHLLKYDDVMNMQRKAIYGLRKDILDSNSQKELLDEFMEYLAENLAFEYGNDRRPINDWPLEELNQAMLSVLYQPIQIQATDVKDAKVEALKNAILEKLRSKYKDQEQRLGPHMDEVEKMFTLATIDHYWKEHLLNLDHLREGIGLRGYAQKDPLLEYKKESFHMFKEMDAQIKQESIAKIFNVQLQDSEAEQEIERYERKQEQNVNMSMHRGESEQQAQKPVTNSGDKVGRNDPCPCGSGKKYKKCHGK